MASVGCSSKSWILTALAIVGLASPGAGQTPGRAVAPEAPPAVGSIEGDAYLVMQNGDVKRGAGRTIFLLRGGEELASARAMVCTAFATRWQERMEPILAASRYRNELIKVASRILTVNPGDKEWVLRGDSLLKADALAVGVANREGDALTATMSVAMDSVLARFLVDTIGTGLNARYKFEQVPAGEYVLFGRIPISDKPYKWWAPLTVRAGQAVTRDLDNSVEAGAGVYCGRDVP